MSTISPISFIGSQAFDNSANASTQANTQAQQTADQQMEQLNASGYSASQIASQLGVPVTEVDTVLDITQVAAAERAVAASRRLSVQA
jgi:hypothetical protein